MKSAIFVLSMCIGGTTFYACCGVAPKPVESTPEPSPEPTSPAAESAVMEPTPGSVLSPPIWMTPEEVDEACADRLTTASELREKISAVSSERTTENTLNPVNDLLIEVYSVLPMSELLANVHPVREVRDASEKCQQEAAKFLNDFSLEGVDFTPPFAEDIICACLGMVNDAISHFPAEIKSPPVILQKIDNAQALLVMPESLRVEFVEHVLPHVAEWGVPQVMPQGNRFRQVLVKVQSSGYGTGYL